MLRLGLRAFSVGWIFLLTSSAALAQCVEDRRAQKVGDNNVQLRTYLCRTGQGPDDAQIKVEIDRLSDAAASIIVTRRKSDMLTQVIGTPKLSDNNISKTYADLLRNFGTTVDRGLSVQKLQIQGAGSGGTGSASEHILEKTIKILGNSYFGSALDYPAIEEIVALENKRIPTELKYFYSIACEDDETISGRDRLSTCKHYDPQKTTMLFWRSMKAADVTNFSRRMTAYNRRYAPKDNAKQIVIPRELRLASHLAGNSWPEDFMIIAGTGKGKVVSLGLSGIHKEFLCLMLPSLRTYQRLGYRSMMFWAIEWHIRDCELLLLSRHDQSLVIRLDLALVH